MSYTAEQPAAYHLLDRDKQTLTELFTARPELKQYRLAPMHAVEGKSRDGLTLVSYLTLPADIESDRPAQPLPMVLVVHGGQITERFPSGVGIHEWQDGYWHMLDGAAAVRRVVIIAGEVKVEDLR
jgi:acylaminoacyl-peptidase